MSKDAFEQFAREMNGNAALDQELTAYVGNAGPAGVLERIATFARERGYDVEPADVRRAQVDGAELSDEELEMVAGGDGISRSCGETGRVRCDSVSWCAWTVFCVGLHYHDRERPYKEWKEILGY